MKIEKASERNAKLHDCAAPDSHHSAQKPEKDMAELVKGQIHMVEEKESVLIGKGLATKCTGCQCPPDQNREGNFLPVSPHPRTVPPWQQGLSAYDVPTCSNDTGIRMPHNPSSPCPVRSRKCPVSCRDRPSFSPVPLRLYLSQRAGYPASVLCPLCPVPPCRCPLPAEACRSICSAVS